jgi:DNA polymerase III epsilon subunit-like protein
VARRTLSKRLLNKCLEDAVFGFFDTETTGLHPESYSEQPDRLVEVAAALYDAQGQEIGSFESLVNPHRGIPAGAYRVHGISDDDVKDAPDARPVLDKMMTFLKPADMVWAFNSPFDVRFVVSAWLEAGVQPPFLAGYDVRRLATDAGFGRAGLQSIAYQMGLPSETQHRALADARLTAKVFFEILLMGFDPQSTIGELMRVHDMRNPVYSTELCVRRLHDRRNHRQTRRRTRRGPAICVTGKLAALSRHGIKERVEAVGYKVSKEVHEALEFVVLGDRPTARKVKDAQDLGVKRLDEEAFMRWLEEREAATDASSGEATYPPPEVDERAGDRRASRVTDIPIVGSDGEATGAHVRLTDKGNELEISLDIGSSVGDRVGCSHEQWMAVLESRLPPSTAAHVRADIDIYKNLEAALLKDIEDLRASTQDDSVLSAARIHLAATLEEIEESMRALRCEHEELLSQMEAG